MGFDGKDFCSLNKLYKVEKDAGLKFASFLEMIINAKKENRNSNAI